MTVLNHPVALHFFFWEWGITVRAYDRMYGNGEVTVTHAILDWQYSFFLAESARNGDIFQGRI
jgi:hypothetical protein